MPDQPKRFKTVLSFRCVQGHINLYDHRIRASSPEEAQKISFEYVRQEARCRYCGSTVTGIQMIGIEQITLHPVYRIFGYAIKESWFAGFEEGRKYPLEESN